jgi:hypothetical protein
MTTAPIVEAEARRRAFTESDSLLIFLLKSRDPARFARKLVAVGGDASMPPVGVNHSGAVRSNVHFYIPSNGRDKPEVLDEPHTIEGRLDNGSAADDDAAA